ncbi:MAG: hypothetical protein WC683_05160 [bacterium]
MKKHNLPLTYPPKIAAVLAEECTQTIRPGRRFAIGDLLSLHGWEGKPYRSKWSFRTPYWPLVSVDDIWIERGGIRLTADTTYCQVDQIRVEPILVPWTLLDRLAAKDGIVPPTGEELGRVLLGMHEKAVKRAGGSFPAQIIRWCPEELIA